MHTRCPKSAGLLLHCFATLLNLGTSATVSVACHQKLAMSVSVVVETSSLESETETKKEISSS